MPHLSLVIVDLHATAQGCDSCSMHTVWQASDAFVARGCRSGGMQLLVSSGWETRRPPPAQRMLPVQGGRIVYPRRTRRMDGRKPSQVVQKIYNTPVVDPSFVHWSRSRFDVSGCVSSSMYEDGLDLLPCHHPSPLVHLSPPTGSFLWVPVWEKKLPLSSDPESAHHHCANQTAFYRTDRSRASSQRLDGQVAIPRRKRSSQLQLADLR